MIWKGLSERRSLAYLRSDEDGRQYQEALRHINAQHKTPVLRYLRKHFDLGEEELEDIFHQTLLILVQNVRSGKFKGDSRLATYMTSIARNTALSAVKRRGRTVSEESLANQPADAHTPEESYLSKELVEKVAWLLDQLKGHNCKAILRFWADGLSAREIAEKLGYNSDGVVRTRKLICLQEWTQIVRRHNFAAELW